MSAAFVYQTKIITIKKDNILFDFFEFATQTGCALLNVKSNLYVQTTKLFFFNFSNTDNRLHVIRVKFRSFFRYTIQYIER